VFLGLFESIKMQTKLRTHVIIPNENIFFPIGTILAVNQLDGILDLSNVFGKHKRMELTSTT
jgi:hypothetical protein